MSFASSLSLMIFSAIVNIRWCVPAYRRENEARHPLLAACSRLARSISASVSCGPSPSRDGTRRLALLSAFVHTLVPLETRSALRTLRCHTPAGKCSCNQSSPAGSRITCHRRFHLHPSAENRTDANAQIGTILLTFIPCSQEVGVDSTPSR